MFNNCGIIQIKKDKISDEEAFEIAIDAGAKDCSQKNGFHEIITKKEDYYKIKTLMEKKINSIFYSAIEWRAINYLDLNKEESRKMIEVLQNLDELDDVQSIFTNANLEN